MTSDEIVVYLANLVLLSGADRDFSPLEAEVIEEVRKETGAERSDMEKALKAVSEGKHRIRPVGRFSDKIRNLEDMIYVALADGEFSRDEKPEILSFAKAIKISQSQINEIFAEAKHRARPINAKKICPSCSREIPPESKFCPKCGANLQDKLS